MAEPSTVSPPATTAPASASTTDESRANADMAPRLFRSSPDGDRKPSVQFAARSEPLPASGSPKTKHQQRGRRWSSPPPPPVFHPRVSFDTFSDKLDPSSAPDILSYSVVRKHKDYEYTKRSRTFLCGIDMSENSDHALEWLIDELVDDGDEIVCLRVVERDSKIAGDASVEDGRYRAEAESLMRLVQAKNTENKAVNLILEFTVGKVHKTIDDMIHLYEPAILIVGTRGRSMSGFQGLLPGSVSKYCLQHSPVPVIVVRPNAKREKKKRKRQEDAGRHSYRALLELSGMQGDALLSQALDAGDGPNEATEAEAVAVAKAIGYNPSIVYDGATAAAATAAAERRRSKSPGRLLKSPEPAGTVESPSTSSRSTDTDNGGDASPGASPGSVPVESSKPAAPAAAATVPIINITNAPTPASVQDGAMSASVEAVKSPRLQDGVRRLSLLEEET